MVSADSVLISWSGGAGQEVFSRLSCHAEIKTPLAGHVLSITGNTVDLSSQFLTQAIKTLGISRRINCSVCFCSGWASFTHTSVCAEIGIWASGNAVVTSGELQCGNWWPKGWNFWSHPQSQGKEERLESGYQANLLYVVPPPQEPK